MKRRRYKPVLYRTKVYLEEVPENCADSYFIGGVCKNKKILHLLTRERVLDICFQMLVRGAELKCNPWVDVVNGYSNKVVKRFVFNKGWILKELEEDLKREFKKNG